MPLHYYAPEDETRGLCGAIGEATYAVSQVRCPACARILIEADVFVRRGRANARPATASRMVPLAGALAD